MRLIIILHIILLITKIKSITLKCEISCETEYQVLGTVCRCKVTEFNSLNRETIDGIEEIGHFNGSLSDIKLLLIDGVNMKFLPSNIHKYLRNLQGLIIDESNLSSIERSDLKYFSNLKFLFIGNNHIDSLDDDLFVDNSKILWLTYINNFTKKIGPNVLASLENLTFANFQRNTCVQYTAGGAGEIEKLIKIIKRDCA